MPQHKELRVHGVSGTPPEAMLYLGAVTYDQSKEHARVFRERTPDDYDVGAYHWGSLTSGNWKTAYWVLLTPFLLANVAGWMGRNSSPWFRFAVRLAGAGLTALFVVELLIVAIDIPLEWADDTGHPVGVVQLLVVAVFLVFLLVILILSTQSHFSHLGWVERFRLTFFPTLQAMLPGKYREPNVAPDEQWTDPGESVLTDGRNWDVHASLHRLRRIHLALGMLMIAITVSVGREQTTQIVVAGVGIAVMIGLLWWTSSRPKDAALQWITALAPAGALLVLGWVTLDMASGFPEGECLASHPQAQLLQRDGPRGWIRADRPRRGHRSLPGQRRPAPQPGDGGSAGGRHHPGRIDRVESGNCPCSRR